MRRNKDNGQWGNGFRQRRGLGQVLGMLLCMALLASCRYTPPVLSGEEVDQRARDSVAYLFERHYTWNTNLVLQADSINLVALPLKESYITLRQGDHVVVAELDVHPNDSVDSIWVKLAHSQEVQGWVRECEMKRAFVPADSISQAIYLFSDTHVPYFIVICALFVAFWLIRMLRRKSFRKSGFGDIDYVYPLLLCLLMAFCATLYETMQVFVPDTWEHFYYNPTLSPFRVPLLLGLASACIFCYFFFILTTGIYVGYVFLALLAVLFVRVLRRSLHTSVYRCGNCGEALAQKGVCPYCGALNE